MTPEQLFERFDRDPRLFTRVPISTWRVQLDRAFTFKDLEAVVSYLAELRVTDCYLSPPLEPSSEHSHGYDIADHNRLNAALGTDPDYLVLAETLRAHGMGRLIDVVPRDILTAEAVEVVQREGRPALAVAAALASFPVALPEQEPEGAP